MLLNSLWVQEHTHTLRAQEGPAAQQVTVRWPGRALQLGVWLGAWHTGGALSLAAAPVVAARCPHVSALWPPLTAPLVQTGLISGRPESPGGRRCQVCWGGDTGASRISPAASAPSAPAPERGLWPINTSFSR